MFRNAGVLCLRIRWGRWDGTNRLWLVYGVLGKDGRKDFTIMRDVKIFVVLGIISFKIIMQLSKI